jgi:molybdopterin synthase sulfur carrier subunit
MAVVFHIPGPLRPFAEGRSTVTVEGSLGTVRDALKALSARYPGIGDRVTTEQGEIREHINVFVGSENIRFTGGLATPLHDGAELSIVPAITGGGLPRESRL